MTERSILAPEYMPADRKPIITPTSISWEHLAFPGNWQMGKKSCMLSALASWCETVYGNKITNAEVSKVFSADKRLGGMNSHVAYRAAKKAGWFKGPTKGLVRSSNLDRLREQPMIAVIKECPSFGFVGNDGVIDCWGGAATMSFTTHAILTIGHEWGDQEWMIIENSRGPSWARDGKAQLRPQGQLRSDRDGARERRVRSHSPVCA